VQTVETSFNFPIVQPGSVRKRDGRTTQPFDVAKIANAVRKAWSEVGGVVDENAVQQVTTFVSATLRSELTDVEQIQDAVEVALMRANQFNVAKAYIIYRQRRSEARAVRGVPDPTAIASYIHASKYARYLPEMQRREVYEETVARVEAMHQKRFAFIPEMKDLITRAFDAVREKRVLPSMRSLQFGGAAVEHNNSRLFNCSATLIDRPRAFAEALFLLLSGCGVGYSVQFEHVEKLPTLTDIDAQRVVHHVIADTIEGWANALDALIDSYLQGYCIEFAYHEIRAAGSSLKTSGGRAPGHVKLKLALERVRGVLHSAQGRKLRPIECHRIMCHTADAVLSGGIRRSAMICLFSVEDSELMTVKTDRDWYNKEPWLANANNSVVLKRDDVKEKQFKRIFSMTQNFGEPGVLFVSDYNHVTNPCQPGWATVLTPEGIRTFDDIEIGSVIWSGKQWTSVTNKVMTGSKQVNAYRTRAGTFYGTENHRIISNGERVEAKDAETIDVALGRNREGGNFDIQTIMDGIVFGDGTVHAASDNAVWLDIETRDQSYFTTEIASLIGRPLAEAHPTAYVVKTTLDAAELPKSYLCHIPSRFRFSNDVTMRSFLRGLYTAKGSVVDGRVTLKASSFSVIESVQEMLTALGIASYHTTNKVQDVTEHYTLNITHGRGQFQRLIGFLQHDKNVQLVEACGQPASPDARKLSYEVVAVEVLDTEPVYDITVEADEHTYWTGGLLVSNCAEIGLDPLLVNADGTHSTGWSMCNLCEINAAKLTSLEDFEQAAWAATLIGTMQAAYTDMPFLGKVTEEIVRRDALLGIGMTGMQDAPHIACNPEYQQIVAGKIVEWNREFAEILDINQAARTTCVKPSGTTSLELGSVGSGIHPHHARRYIRRVTADSLEVVFKAFQAVNPTMCVRKPDRKWVIEFPVEAPEGAVLKEDLSAHEFMDMVRSTQQNWVVPGATRPSQAPGLSHNVSNTISVKPTEWETVADYLWTHRDDFTGVSLLPDSGDMIYSFAPFEAVKTEEQERRWNELVAVYKPVDYHAMFEAVDGTDLTAEAACAGGACSIA
jgi:ribonucleotide reductase alpha subunit